MSTSPKHYHGGNRGLRVGEFILPPAETGRQCTSDLVANQVHRRDRAYITPDIAAASLYASVHQQPTVYEVLPEGELEPHPDCFEPGLSWACRRAKIIAIHKVPGKVIKKARAALRSP